MAGDCEQGSPCPTCGGRLHLGTATVPFLLDGSVAVVRGVPAEICASCHEPYMAGAAVDRVMALLSRFRACGAEVSVVAYPADEAPAELQEDEARAAA